MNLMRTLSFCAAALCLHAAARAQEVPAAAGDVLVFANGDQLHGSLERLDADRIAWRHGGVDAPIRFAAAGISKLEFARAAGRPPVLRVLLATGESLPCDTVVLDDAKAELGTGYGGKIVLPRKLIAQIECVEVEASDKKDGKDKPEQAVDGLDHLVTRTGDKVSGHLLGIADGKVRIQTDVAGVVEILLERIDGITLPAPVSPLADPGPAASHIRLVGGGRLALKLERVEAGIVQGRHAQAGDLRLKLDVVEGLDLAGEAAMVWRTTASGLRYRIVKVGGKEHPGAEDTVKVHYDLHLKDGTRVDASVDHGGPNEFPLNAVVAGFAEGTRLIGRGGKVELVVPPNLGYGDLDIPKIPKGSALHFTVELVDFTPQAGGK